MTARGAPPVSKQGGGGRAQPADVVARAEEVAPGIKLVAHSGTFESAEQWKGFVKEIRAAWVRA